MRQRLLGDWRFSVLFLTLLCAFSVRGLSQQPETRDLKTIVPQKNASVAIPRSYALVIGIAKYKNLPESSQLQYPNRDADDVYTTLISAEGGQFPAENVHKLVDDKATIANIRHELEVWLPSVTKDDDRVLIYFAGHGFVSGGKGYLASYDVDIHNIVNTAYPMTALGEQIGSKIKGKWKVLVTDACHSGAITPESDRAQVNQTLLDLQKSLFSLTASRDREQSFESENWGGGHGIFSYYVVKGLQGEADTNGDGVVSADELAEYVHSNVRLATQAQQNPTSERGSFDPDMVLAYNPSHVKGANLPPPQFGSLIVETNMDDTEIWVDGKSAGVVGKGAPLRLPGIAPGAHTIKAVRLGYEPDGPREVQVYPGQDTTVTARILIARQHNKTAVEHFDKGIENYNKGSEPNYKKAAEEFRAALNIDPKYSQAALYLGRVENALFEDQQALAAFKTAIETDPDYLEARASYGRCVARRRRSRRGGPPVERHHNARAAQRYGLVSALASLRAQERLLRRKVRRGTGHRRDAQNAEAHFWLAQCLRLMNRPADAEAEYNSYLALSNFDSGFGGKLNYYLAGYLFGTGQKKRAAQTDIWRELRGQANFGICDCEYALKRYGTAVPYCQQALSYIPKDLYANYRLGLLYAQEFNQQNSVGLLAAAKEHFSEVVAVAPNTDEAGRSKKYLQMIDSALAKQP